MAEALTRKKKTQAALRSSATRIMNQLVEDSASEEGPTLERLLQSVKVITDREARDIKTLDEEIIALIDEGALEDQIAG